MKRVYTTANGKQISVDALIAQNEDTIAVGNMKVNARGDQLGPGGKVEAKREQVMNDYYKLNTPVAVDVPATPHEVRKKPDLVDDWIEPVQTTAPVINEEPEEVKPALRGSLADSVAKVHPQEKAVPKRSGPSRI